MKIEGYDQYCTVGDLKEFLAEHNLPNDAKILIQRVEDKYFEKHGWKTINKEGQFYNEAIEFNKKIDGEFNDKEQYPDLEVSDLKKIEGEELNQCKEKYIVAWCPVKYPNDNNLYLDAHY